MNNRCFKCGAVIHNGGFYFCSKRCRYKYHHSGPLILPIKRKWFDLIKSGIKTEEYREIKPYWETRFNNYFGRIYDFSSETPIVVYGKEEWGAEPGKKYYVLKIHKVYL